MRCKTIDLEAPASAEILIEGHLSLDETADEGPMGEYAGYLWPGESMKRQAYRVTAVSQRDRAILPVAVAGEPIDEDHTRVGDDDDCRAPARAARRGPAGGSASRYSGAAPGPASRRSSS